MAYNDIALSLSGGGYRAAAFHLGTMSYLDRVDLLEKVTIISTVSGGTFTGALYALKLSQGKAFKETYDLLTGEMEKVDLIKEALEKLSSSKRLDRKRSDNLINAMAEIYHEKFFEGATFGEILSAKGIHLKEIIFNATEFNSGLSFRFQKSDSPNARIGNGNLSIDKGAAGELRLADIVAASSCFPMGFEPLKFPDDFQYEGAKQLGKLKNKAPFNKPVGLMDGGIVDNQGIGSVIRAVERRGKQPDLFIISDVSSPFMDPFEFPKESKGKGLLGKLTLHSAKHYILTLIFLMTLGIIALMQPLLASTVSITDKYGVVGYIVHIFIPILLAGLIFGLYKIYRLFNKDMFEHIPKLGSKAEKYLDKLTLGRYKELVTIRLKSAITMVSDVFMKQVRRLVYAQVYLDDKYKPTLLSNLIYSLRSDTVINRKGASKYNYMTAALRNPSKEIIDVTERACSMKTTLWFTEEELSSGKMGDLIACGQFTICFRLIENIVKRHGDHVASYPADVKKLYQQCMKDWDSFNQDPSFMAV